MPIVTRVVARRGADVGRGSWLGGSVSPTSVLGSVVVMGPVVLASRARRSHSNKRLASSEAPMPRKTPLPTSQLCQRSIPSMLVTRAVARIGVALSQTTLLVSDKGGIATSTVARAVRLPPLICLCSTAGTDHVPCRPLIPVKRPAMPGSEVGNSPTSGHTWLVWGPSIPQKLPVRWMEPCREPMTVVPVPLPNGLSAPAGSRQGVG